MKKIITLVLTFLFSYTFASAQCTPDVSITVPGIYPDSATGLPHAIVGQNYQSDIQFRVLTDTTYIGLPATIDSIKVTGITGLPSGFTYSCTPSSCNFRGGTNGCVQITGSAPGSAQIGTYPLVVNLTIYGRILGIPQSITDQNDNYRIVIDNNTGVYQLVNNGGFQISQNFPNPFRTRTDVEVYSTASAKGFLKITDLLGNSVRQQTLQLNKGINLVQIDGRDLAPGVYMYTIQDGRNAVTRRMIVSGN